jgi:hypothetical protein
LFDVPEAPLPDPDTPAPVRFLPQYDNVALGHADRTRIVSEEDRKRLLMVGETSNPIFGGVLVDGFAGAIWRLARARGRERVTLNVELLRPVSAQHEAELVDEGQRLVRFLEGDEVTPEVRVAAMA